ncbi:hypothetical protein AVEN_97072-1 [Araneus ventricosus]|uniref:Uncharacterized protein n=1 Tax=Araneus ventricosus TaxID=182803 RepID=A0A4Y2EI47_ARAVE|nr:hypothetical protein AVEN_97072-1 [Araneus ventricosus]
MAKKEEIRKPLLNEVVSAIQLNDFFHQPFVGMPRSPHPPTNPNGEILLQVKISPKTTFMSLQAMFTPYDYMFSQDPVFLAQTPTLTKALKIALVQH